MHDLLLYHAKEAERDVSDTTSRVDFDHLETVEQANAGITL